MVQADSGNVDAPGGWYASSGKRVFDLLAGACLCVMALPLMLAVAGLVWIRLGRPVVFRHERPGLRGHLFTLYKFRTMADTRDGQGALLPDAQRLSGVGRVLRSTSLDELPECWNVLRGDMSLVGPRPLLTQYMGRYSAEQARRHLVRPGITGWAQVNGRNAITWEQKFALDVWYVNHLSWWLDVRILARTAWKILSREGISSPGQATMEEFRGAASATEGRAEESR